VIIMIIFQVVGLSHLAHLATFKGGFAKPIPLAQGRNIKIVSKTTFPMQIDGEPWIQGPCIMDIGPLER
jgi:diacylglycerol kinase (ATP)